MHETKGDCKAVLLFLSKKGTSKTPRAKYEQDLCFITVFLCIQAHARKSERKRPTVMTARQTERRLDYLYNDWGGLFKTTRQNSCTPTSQHHIAGFKLACERSKLASSHLFSFFPASSWFLSLQVSESQSLTHKVNLEVAHTNLHMYMRAKNVCDHVTHMGSPCIHHPPEPLLLGKKLKGHKPTQTQTSHLQGK